MMRKPKSRDKKTDGEAVLPRVIRYEIYILVSFGIGFVSTLGEKDFVANLSQSLLPVLIALLILYTTISSFLFNQLSGFHDEGYDITGVIKAMKRNVRVEILVLFVTFLMLATQSWLLGVLPKYFPLNVICNVIVVFAIVYFVYVVYDSTMGLYRLYEHSLNTGNDSNEETE